MDRPKRDLPTTEIYKQSEEIITYNRQIEYYSTRKKNERFLNGDQWKGVDVGSLPKPQVNLFKKTFAYIIAWLTSSKTTIKYTVKGVDFSKADDENATEDERVQAKKMRKVVDLLNKKIEEHREDNRFEHMLARNLQDAVIGGNFASFCYWDMDVPSDDAIEGDLITKRLNPSRVLFGDPNTPEVNFRGKPLQPYIIITGRDTVANLKKERKKYLEKKGVNYSKEEMESELNKIVADDEHMSHLSSDRSEIELDSSVNQDSVKATYYIRLRYDDDEGYVMKQKATRTSEITDEEQTKMTIYPLAWSNWTIRDDSYRGQSPMTGYIPNQVFVNKAVAIIMIAMMNNASPRIAYDSSKINGITNSVSGAIKSDGDVNNAIKVLSVGGVSNNIMNVIEYVANNTIQSLGGNQTILGNVNPVNKSAIDEVTQQTSIPFENQRKSLYDFAEQLGYIWFEYFKAYYGDEDIVVTYDIDGQQFSESFNLGDILDKNVKVKVDVGASSYFSEITSDQILGNLLSSGVIEVVDYLERIDDSKMPKKQELIDSLKERQAGMMDEQVREEWEKVMQFVEQLPPEFQEQFYNVINTPGKE